MSTRVISTSITRAVISHLDSSGMMKGEKQKRRLQGDPGRESQAPSVVSGFDVNDGLQLGEGEGSDFVRSTEIGSSRERRVVHVTDFVRGTIPPNLRLRALFQPPPAAR